MKYNLNRELKLLERRALLGCPKRERQSVAARIRMAVGHAIAEAFTQGRQYPPDEPLPADAITKAARRANASIHEFIAEDRRREHQLKPRRRPPTEAGAS